MIAVNRIRAFAGRPQTQGARTMRLCSEPGLLDGI